ncbi:hypothetical protein V2I01_05190 [Micromonospora sp. BRA006-A]|nr:hypothetical protein [Micromonospora sp. BRA006-A]
MPSVTEPATAADTEDATGASALASPSTTPEAADDRTSAGVSAEEPSGAAGSRAHDGTPHRPPTPSRRMSSRTAPSPMTSRPATRHPPHRRTSRSRPARRPRPLTRSRHRHPSSSRSRTNRPSRRASRQTRPTPPRSTT